MLRPHPLPAVEPMPPRASGTLPWLGAGRHVAGEDLRIAGDEGAGTYVELPPTSRIQYVQIVQYYDVTPMTGAIYRIGKTTVTCNWGPHATTIVAVFWTAQVKRGKHTHWPKLRSQHLRRAAVETDPLYNPPPLFCS
jgi:hypothetical protein